MTPVPAPALMTSPLPHPISKSLPITQHASSHVIALHNHTLISSSIFQWAHTGASVLAQMAPLAATAGRPMPGKVESPQAMSPGMGVRGPGKVPWPALMAGP